MISYFLDEETEVIRKGVTCLGFEHKTQAHPSIAPPPWGLLLCRTRLQGTGARKPQEAEEGLSLAVLLSLGPGLAPPSISNIHCRNRWDVPWLKWWALNLREKRENCNTVNLKNSVIKRNMAAEKHTHANKPLLTSAYRQVLDIELEMCDRCLCIDWMCTTLLPTPHKFICWSSNSQCSCIWRQGIWGSN